MAKKKYIGQTSKATNGMTLKITGFRNIKDIDVVFVEDGYEVHHTRYWLFESGNIRNPNDHIHEKFKTNTGEEIEIIDYKDYNHVTVQFKDGSTKTTNYSAIKNGSVLKQGQRVLCIETRIGETSIASCGQIMTIIKARSSKDIDVQFENGDIAKNKTYNSFKNGNIDVPHRHINDIEYGKTRILLSNTFHWKCKCQNCGFEDYMTIEQMKQHNCQETTDFITNVTGA